jgi:hypothetical protein
MRGSTTNTPMASKSDYPWMEAKRVNSADLLSSARINCVVQIDPTFELEGLPVGENWRGAGECFLSIRHWSRVLLLSATRLDKPWAGNPPLPASQRRSWCRFLLFAVRKNLLRCSPGRTSAANHMTNLNGSSRL